MKRSIAASVFAVMCGIAPLSAQADDAAGAPWVVGEIVSLLKNVFGPGRGWRLISADDFHQPRGKFGDS
jgi:hypothetical protein